MELSDQMEHALTEQFKWFKGTVPELDEPELLIVFNYSPHLGKPLLSIAFDLSGGARCWMSERTEKQGNKGPNPHSDYRTFEHDGTTFLPYSITSLGTGIFVDVQKLEAVCESLYQYAVFD